MDWLIFTFTTELYDKFLNFSAAVQKTQDGKKYQVAWTEEVKNAKSGDYEVNLYDDNGYSAMKRVLERGDDPSSVKPLVTIMVNHPVSWLFLDWKIFREIKLHWISFT